MQLARHLDESPSAEREVVSSLPAGPPETGQESARCALEYFSQFRWSFLKR